MNSNLAFEIRPISQADRAWMAQFIRDRWGSTQIVSRGVVHKTTRLPGFIAVHDDHPAGLVTYHIDGAECEIVTLDSPFQGMGIGTALIQAVRQAALEAGCSRLWLITTNDNLPALRFYQKRGFRLSAFYRGAVDQARKIKPEIPKIGMEGIPIHDEIELEMKLPVGEDH
ncbi:MAG: GNAT family N-acetyltransferase [Anaerolineales bacterium]|jgi:GNAT superfamily N-acetyltransferase